MLLLDVRLFVSRHPQTLLLVLGLDALQNFLRREDGEAVLT
jgi:hypothetical protein